MGCGRSPRWVICGLHPIIEGSAIPGASAVKKQLRLSHGRLPAGSWRNSTRFWLVVLLSPRYHMPAGPEDRATQACDPSAAAGGYTAGRLGPGPGLFLLPLAAQKAINAASTSLNRGTEPTGYRLLRLRAKPAPGSLWLAVVTLGRGGAYGGQGARRGAAVSATPGRRLRGKPPRPGGIAVRDIRKGGYSESAGRGRCRGATFKCWN